MPLKQFKVTLTGIRPLIMHNGRLADPEDSFTKQIDAINKKKGKDNTPEVKAERERIEWEGSLYWDDEHGLTIPTDNLERCIQLGGQRSRIGKKVQAGVWVVESECVPLQHQRQGDTLKDLYKLPEYRLRKGVAIQKGRIMRCRPMVPTGWKLSFTLAFDTDVIGEDDLEKAVVDAGILIGLGDWRPKFGRFTAEFK